MFDNDSGDRQNVPPIGDKPLTIPAAIVWFMLATSGSMFLIGVTYGLWPETETDLVNALGCQAAAYVFSLFGIVRIHSNNKPLSQVLGLRQTHPAFYLLGALLGLVLQVPAELLQRAVFFFKPIDPELLERQADMMRMDSNLSRIMIPVSVIVVGPLVEELFFRGALFGGLRQNNGTRSAFLMVSLLFAGAHGSFLLFIPLFVVGAVVTLLRASSGSVWPSLVMHAVFNSVPVAGIVFGWFELKVDPQPLPLALSIGGVAATLILIAAVLAISRSSAAHHAQQEDLK